MAYYVRGQTGNNGSAGTSGATAKKTHAGVAALSPAADSIINHAERQDATASATLSGARLILKNEDGSAGVSPAIIRGVQYPTFAATGTRSFRANVGAITIGRVMDRYASRVGSDGRPYGFLSKAASSAAVDTAGSGAGTWYYDGATWLYVQLSDGTDPTTLTGDDRVGYTLANAGALVLTGGGVTVQDLKLQCVTPGDGLIAYQIQTNNGGARISRVFCETGGVHNAVCLESTNDIIEDSVFSGCGIGHSGAESNNCIGYYSSVGHVTGSRSRRNKFLCYTFLKADQTPVNASAGCSGIVVHTNDANGTTRAVKDFQSTDDISIHYGQAGQLIEAASVNPALPPNVYDPKTYPVRVVRGTQRGSMGLVHDCHISYENCFIDMTSFAGFGNTYAMWLFASGVQRVVAFFGCTLLFDQGTQAGAHMMRLQPNVWLLLVHCTIINRGIASGPHQFFSLTDATCKVTAYANIFKNCVSSLANTRFMNGDTGATLDFQGNWYHGIASNAWGNTTSTQAAWLDPSTGIDRTGVYGDPMFINPQSTDPMIAGSLQPGSPLLNPTRKASVPVKIAVGPNGGTYDGTVGSNQHGPRVAAMSRSGFVNIPNF